MDPWQPKFGRHAKALDLLIHFVNIPMDKYCNGSKFRYGRPYGWIYVSKYKNVELFSSTHKSTSGGGGGGGGLLDPYDVSVKRADSSKTLRSNDWNIHVWKKRGITCQYTLKGQYAYQLQGWKGYLPDDTHLIYFINHINNGNRGLLQNYELQLYNLWVATRYCACDRYIDLQSRRYHIPRM